MSFDVRINNQPVGPAYIGWSPVPCTIAVAGAGAGPASVTLKNIQVTNGGAVAFLTQPNAQAANSLNLTIPANGNAVNFFIAGSVASTEDQDATIGIFDTSTGAKLDQTSLMVRIRKNANTLLPNERDRFLSALVKFNLTQGSPNYLNFLDMHNQAAFTEIHSNGNFIRYSFLLWHRAYVLDLERQLQKFDASVAIPYWKFDEPAPNIFTADFMGNATPGTGTLSYSPTNPLNSWSSNGKPTLTRSPNFTVQTSAGVDPGQGPIPTDAETLALGTDFADFRQMEDSPHGYAHECFVGPIDDIFTAPQDPMFFLLHCNVDRLWALWQMQNNRYNLSQVNTYPYSGAYNPASKHPMIGDYLDDTIWPWNQVTGKGANGANGNTRPPTAPGGPFPQISQPATPSGSPKLWQMIDYQGYNGGEPSFADYDVIPYN
jgi:tyrosinase